MAEPSCVLASPFTILAHIAKHSLCQITRENRQMVQVSEDELSISFHAK